MWVLFARAAAPDASYWPGRRWLAALDAVGWPAFWLIMLAQSSAPTRLVGAVLATLAIIVGARRLRIALWHNHRYRFAIWRWGRLVLTLLVFGAAMKHMTTQ